MRRKWLKTRRFFWNTIREIFDLIMDGATAARWWAKRRSIKITEKLEETDN